MTIWQQHLADRLFGKIIQERITQAVKAVDDDQWRAVNTPPLGTDRPWHEHIQELERIERLCRTNPLASRLVSLTTDFVVGRGATLQAPQHLHDFWHHPQNDLDRRLYRWCDELARSGELFLVLSRVSGSGLSYIREVPARCIDRIETNPHDLEDEQRYHQLTANVDGRWWPAAARPGRPLCPDDQIMLHYAVNRPLGALRGRSDLAQLTDWLEHYTMWLEDRVRINRYKSAYLWHVTIKNPTRGAIQAKQSQYARPPQPGSIIISDDSEVWEALSPHIDAPSVEDDGRALRLMIAAGAGVPLHYLAETESATRATAREQAAPTFRHFAHRQALFSRIIEDLLRVASRRAGHPETASDPDIHVSFEPVETTEDADTSGDEHD